MRETARQPWMDKAERLPYSILPAKPRGKMPRRKHDMFSNHIQMPIDMSSTS